MSGAPEQGRKRRPPRMFLVSTDLRLQDELEGTIRVQRGFMCQELSACRSKDWLWIKVLDNGCMLKIEKKFLVEIPSDIAGLLEPVVDPEARLKLLTNPRGLQQLAALKLDAPLWARIGQQDELAEAELKYVGPLTRGSSAVLFGVQLKGSAAGKGSGNGSFKGHRLFSCPDACALFLPASDIQPRQWSSKSEAHAAKERDPPPHHQQHHHQHPRRSGNVHPGNGHHANNVRPNHHQHQQHQAAAVPPPLPSPGRHHHHPDSPTQPQALGILPRTADSAPPAAAQQNQIQPAPPFLAGQRVCFPLDDTVHGGEVRFCGLLPGWPSSGMYVGVQLDSPVGNWDGHHKGERLCHISSAPYGVLLPVAKVSREPKSQRLSPPHPTSKSNLRPAPPPVAKPGPVSPSASGPRVALMPPGKAGLKPPPPLPPPKPAQKAPPPPPPPPKPRSPTAAVGASEQPRDANGGAPEPRVPPLSPDPLEARGGESVDAGQEGQLEVGSMVEVNDPPIFGVICWIGRIDGITHLVAGIELDQELSAGTDGSYLGRRHFRCPANKGLFVKLANCRRDSRFPAPETPVNQVERCNSIAFAEWGSERVAEHTPPPDAGEARELYRGWKRGIQGHLNSCYLDATLFGLFSCCSSADWVLFWPLDPVSHPDSGQAQDLLRCEIVNPLRSSGYVCASKTMALRRLLESSDTDTGFTNQEKDPEEFLNRLFQLLRVEPLLKIRSMTHQPQECHLYQLFPPTGPASPSSPPPTLDSPVALSSPPPSRMRVASVQALLETSFLHAGLKFVEAPSCLLLLMPRFGKDFKMFDAILPSLSLDITDLLDDSLRQCSICQAVAEWECLQCYDDADITPGRLKQYCPTCNTQVHSHRKRTSHGPLRVGVPGGGPWPGPLHCARQRMSLFAVTCIETSHYVSFIKHGPLATDWLFFDSMADREGGENGFNVPRVAACPEVGRYLGLSEDELSRVDAAALREPARRLLCDSYMCLYHSPELSLYK